MSLGNIFYVIICNAYGCVCVGVYLTQCNNMHRSLMWVVV